MIFLQKRDFYVSWHLILCKIYRVMNGINAPKLVECFGSDGHRYRQLAKSGNDDLRQDAVSICAL